jgi:outer membrane lipase/esterase
MNSIKKKYAGKLIACAAFLFALPNPSQAQTGHQQIFILGDSVSDAGNRYLMTGESTKSPYPLVPTYPYNMGGFHYSNGKTWAERIAQDLNDVSGGKASRAAPGKNGNYAHGGARGRNNVDHPSPDSLEQAMTLVVDYNGAPPDALYVVQFGGNDVRDALEAAQSDQSLATSFGILFNAVYEVQGTINSLYAAGARNFLVANSPDLANTPAINLSGPVAGFLTGIFVGTYNGELENRLIELETKPGIVIHRFNMFDFTNKLVSNPGDYGLTNVTSPCLNFLVESGGKCDNPEDYLFWDGLHPTAVGHRAIAKAALAALNGN